MRLDRITAKNFLTFESLEYEFERRPLLIQGLNLTDEKQKSNGSGKSGMMAIIEFCITASNSRDVKDSELVSYGNAEANVGLLASCDHRKESIQIDWTIKVKGSNKLKVSTFDSTGKEDELSFSNVNDGKKAILAWFAISKEDLFNYYLINNSRFKSFFKSSNKEKVDLINRFSDASIIEGLEKIDNSVLDSEFNSLSNDIAKLDGKVELVQENIAKEKARDFGAELKEKLDEFNEEVEFELDEISDCKDEILSCVNYKKADERDLKSEELRLIQIGKEVNAKNIILKDVVEVLTKAQKEVSDFKGIDKTKELQDITNDHIDLTDTVNLEDDSLSTWKTKSEKLETLLGSINIKLGGSITCPSCTHEFILDGDIDELNKNKVHAEKMVVQISTKIEDCKSSINEAELKLFELEVSIKDLRQLEQDSLVGKSKLLEASQAIMVQVQNATTVVNNLDREFVDCESMIQKIKSKIVEGSDLMESIKRKVKGHNTNIAEFKVKISDLKADNNKSLISTLKNDLSSLESLKQTNSKALTELGDKIYERNQWINNFKQFRMFLANQSLDAIEFHCNRYLNDMGSDLKVKMEGFKMLANGTFKDEITARIIRDVERSFSSFSGGERGRLLFASILANRHMINATHPYGGLDFLSVDEVFEGVDSVGLKHLIKSAKTLNITAMIITHVSDEDASSDVLTIVKENGVSTIKQN
jgi:exonuclease SbcC